MRLTLVGIVVCGLLRTVPALAQEHTTLNFEQAIEAALANDHWQQGNESKRMAMLANSEAVAALPNPVMSVGLANLASDSFAFNQEPMTQLKVGITQKFARGDSLTLSKQQLIEQSRQFPMLGLERQAKLTVAVGQTWLRAYQAKQTMALISKDRPLFEQLIDLAQRSYQVGQGRTMQSDLISAQVELTALDDRLASLETQARQYRQQLNQWLPTSLANALIDAPSPKINLLTPPQSNTQAAWASLLANHPSLMALNAKQTALKTGIELAEQGDEIQWGVNTSYGWRSNSPNGSSRSDLFSVGVSFDLPIFNHHKTRQQVAAAKANAKVLTTDKLLLIQQMRANAMALQSTLAVLVKRHTLYQDKLLPQTIEQSQAALTAYGNDKGDFSRVVLARVGELNRRIEHLNISVEMNITKLKLNYYLAQARGSYE